LFELYFIYLYSVDGATGVATLGTRVGLLTQHNDQCYFPSTGTENRSNSMLSSVCADGKQHAYICYFASLWTENKCNHMLFSIPMDRK